MNMNVKNMVFSKQMENLMKILKTAQNARVGASESSQPLEAYPSKDQHGRETDTHTRSKPNMDETSNDEPLFQLVLGSEDGEQIEVHLTLNSANELCRNLEAFIEDHLRLKN